MHCGGEALGGARKDKKVGTACHLPHHDPCTRKQMATDETLHSPSRVVAHSYFAPDSVRSTAESQQVPYMYSSHDPEFLTVPYMCPVMLSLRHAQAPSRRPACPTVGL